MATGGAVTNPTVDYMVVRRGRLCDLPGMEIDRFGPVPDAMPLRGLAVWRYPF
jgi:hypothetical protein